MRRRLLLNSNHYDPFNGYDYVDMGEAGYWATCNIGASKPEEYGLYFAWGETEPKEIYDYDTYKFGGDWSGNQTKYVEKDGLTILEPEDDAAHVIMGGDWRMPTSDEAWKLRNLSNFEWVNDYKNTGVNGTLFILKSDPTKQLFLPASGYQSESKPLQNGGKISYMWISETEFKNPSKAFFLQSENNGRLVIEGNTAYRCTGIPIRAVIPKPR